MTIFIKRLKIPDMTRQKVRMTREGVNYDEPENMFSRSLQSLTLPEFPKIVVLRFQSELRLYTNIPHEEAQFFKQGPAYKKEGPDPNKGSNQQ